MYGTSEGTPGGLAVGRGLLGLASLRLPIVLAVEGLILAAAAASVNIPSLVIQVFRAVLTF
jgi:hypothetical protein